MYGRVMPLIPHGLHGDVVVDARVALRVAGDPDAGERAAHLGQPGEQRQGAVEPAGRGIGVPRGHEHVVHPAGEQPGHDGVQVRVVHHQPRGQVRHHPVAPGRQPLGQVQRGVQPLAGEAVTVTVMPGGTQSATACSTDPDGKTS